MQSQTGNMLFVARNHFQSPAAGMIENGPDRRHGLGEQEGQTAQRIDVFLNLSQALGAVDRRDQRLGDLQANAEAILKALAAMRANREAALAGAYDVALGPDDALMPSLLTLSDVMGTVTGKASTAKGGN